MNLFKPWQLIVVGASLSVFAFFNVEAPILFQDSTVTLTQNSLDSFTTDDQLAQVAGAVTTANVAADVNKDGKITLADLLAVSNHVKNHVYDAWADVNKDKVINLADAQYILQYLDRSTRLDLNSDGKIDLKDLKIVSAGLNTKYGTAGYTILADINLSGAIDLDDARSVFYLIDRQTRLDLNADGVIDLKDLKIMMPALGYPYGSTKYSLLSDINVSGGTDLDDARSIFYMIDRQTRLDLNGDGKIDLKDLNIVGLSTGTQYGQANYNLIADINLSGSTDLDDARSIFYMIDRQTRLDLNMDGKINLRDLKIVGAALGNNYGSPNYSLLADINLNGSIDLDDARAIFYMLDRQVRLDLNMDGVVNNQDIAIVKAALGATLGTTKYNVLADINMDGIIDNNDLIAIGGTPVPTTATGN